jgi:hypothetical protein
VITCLEIQYYRGAASAHTSLSKREATKEEQSTDDRPNTNLYGSFIADFTEGHIKVSEQPFKLQEGLHA